MSYWFMKQLSHKFRVFMKFTVLFLYSRFDVNVINKTTCCIPIESVIHHTTDIIRDEEMLMLTTANKDARGIYMEKKHAKSQTLLNYATFTASMKIRRLY